jgi:hypothetical protein
MWQTIGTLAGVILGAAMSFWFQRVERRAAAKERWAERAAEALADVEILLTDAQPQRVTMSMNRDTVGAQVSELSARGAVVRRQVAVLSAGHPDAQVRHTAGDLETAIFNSIASLGWLVSDMLRHADSAEQLKTAMSDHETGRRLAREIEDRLHR